MGQNFAASSEQNFFIVFPPLLAIKGRVVTSKAIDANPLAKRSLSEYKIPRRLRIKVFHRYRQDTKSI